MESSSGCARCKVTPSISTVIALDLIMELTGGEVAGIEAIEASRLADGAETFLAVDDLLNAHAVIAVEDHDLPACHQAVVDQDLDRLIDPAVELDDRAGSQLQDVLERKLGPAERD